MLWTDLPNSDLMYKIFNTQPEIDKINLFKIKVNNETASIEVFFDLINAFPDNSPKRTFSNQSESFNTCHTGISCLGISCFKISGVLTDMLVKIKFDLSSDKKKIVMESDNCYAEILCDSVSLITPSVYLNAAF